jgi:hypothetical protein
LQIRPRLPPALITLVVLILIATSRTTVIRRHKTHIEIERIVFISCHYQVLLSDLKGNRLDDWGP